MRYATIIIIITMVYCSWKQDACALIVVEFISRVSWGGRDGSVRSKMFQTLQTNKSSAVKKGNYDHCQLVQPPYGNFDITS